MPQARPAETTRMPLVGRSQTSGHYTTPTTTHGSAPFSSALSKSHTMMGGDSRAGAPSSPFTSRSMTSPNMSPGLSPMVTDASPSTAKTMPNLMHAKLHKRGGSGSGFTLPGAQPAMATSLSDIEPFPSITPTSPKVKKPYLRKLSSTKDDQGRIDLSKSLSENQQLAGLGIQDYRQAAPKSHHARTTSVGSQMSNTSGSYRPQPFVHPMRQAPRPYTPTTSLPHDEDDIQDDEFVDRDYKPTFSFRPRRSMSNSSAQAPTPLSQTITSADLGMMPRLTSTSQSNLSIVSTMSSRFNSRRNTGRSELAASPSSRTSLDRPTLGARKSDTEAQTRDERIQEARRKFQEKEAGKDRKAEKEAMKRREAEEAREQRRQQRQRGKSDASDRARPQRPGTAYRTGSALGMVSSLAYEPEQTQMTPTLAEKQPRVTQKLRKEEKSPGFFFRLFSCGG